MGILGGATRKFVEAAIAAEAEECIIWPYALDQRGYPQAQDANGFYKPHRRVCEALNGPPPSAKHHAAHLCGKRTCLNGLHLIWATPRENEGHKNVHGSVRRGNRLLTDDDVRSIRQRHEAGEMMKDLAKEFSITPTAIAKITKWRTYRDVR